MRKGGTSLNEHLCNFIRLITSHPEETLHFSFVSAQLKVSERMIRNYCASTEEFLGTEVFSSLFQVNSSSVLYSGNAEQTEALISQIHNTDFYNYKLSRKERLPVISLLLLLSHMPITIAQLEGFLYVSRGTLLKDLEIIQRQFETRHLYFTKNKSRGYILECAESQKRNAVFQVLAEIHPLDHMFFSQRYNICLGFVNRFLKLDKHYTQMELILQQMEKHFSIQLSDHHFYCLIIYLCVIILRLTDRCFVEPCIPAAVTGLPIAAADFIMQKFETYSPCYENEVQYLAGILKEEFFLHLQDQEDLDAVRFQLAVHEFLTALSLSYGEDLTQDSHLAEYLAAHLHGTWHRLSHKKLLHNPLKEQMLKEYGQDFLILKQHLPILEKEMGTSINDHEAAYILMHVVSAVRRLFNQEHVLEVIIACNTGMGTANFLAESIRKYLKLHIVSVTSIHSLPQLLTRQNADFIISTVPLRSCRLPWIQIHAVPTREDILAIQIFTNEIAEKLISHRQQFRPEMLPLPKSKPASPPLPVSFSSLLTEGHILLNRSVHDWKDAVITAGEPLLFEQIISCEYLNAMVSSVIENGPYIVFAPGIALAHASPEFGVQDMGVVLLRPAAPVPFGHPLNDPVHIVAALCMQESASHINILFHIMNILCNRYAFHELLSAGTEDEVREIIKRYENTSLTKM